MKKLMTLKSLIVGCAVISGAAYGANPASVNWVTEQLQNLNAKIQAQFQALVPAQTSAQIAAEMQTKINSLSPGVLTAADWQALCPAGVISSGCFPNCQGAQAAACSKVLSITGVENQVGVPETYPTGMYVISLSPQPNSSGNGPTINNGSANNATCGLYSPGGRFIPPGVDQYIMMVGSVINNIAPQSFGAGATNQSYSINPIYTTNGTPHQTTYYLICLAYPTPGGGISIYNGDASGLSASW